MVVVVVVNDSDDGDVVRNMCLLCGWMEITVWFVTTNIPPRPTGWASRTYHEQALRIQKRFGRGQRWMDVMNRDICSRRGGRNRFRVHWVGCV